MLARVPFTSEQGGFPTLRRMPSGPTKGKAQGVFIAWLTEITAYKCQLSRSYAGQYQALSQVITGVFQPTKPDINVNVMRLRLESTRAPLIITLKVLLARLLCYRLEL
jgi:hypothetical protein